MNFCVSDEEKQRCSDAAAWLYLELNHLFDACHKKLENEEGLQNGGFQFDSASG
jgi:hypothetical protein